MEGKFLIGTKLEGSIFNGFYLDRRIAISKNIILNIKEGVYTEDCLDLIEKCSNEPRITDVIKSKPYLGTYIYYKNPQDEKAQEILLFEDFDECISQLQS